MANWIEWLTRGASAAMVGLALLLFAGCEPAKKTPTPEKPKADANPKHGEPGHIHVDGDEHADDKKAGDALKVDEDLKAGDAATGEPTDPLEPSDDSGPTIEKGEPKDPVDLKD
jgi:hypothetical protein